MDGGRACNNLPVGADMCCWFDLVAMMNPVIRTCSKKLSLLRLLEVLLWEEFWALLVSLDWPDLQELNWADSWVEIVSIRTWRLPFLQQPFFSTLDLSARLLLVKLVASSPSTASTSTTMSWTTSVPSSRMSPLPPGCPTPGSSLALETVEYCLNVDNFLLLKLYLC